MYKANVGDFPLKVHPCKYWWVRYAVACTYFSDKQGEMTEAYREHIDLQDWAAHSGGYENREIWVGGTSDEFKLEPGSELYKRINDFIRQFDSIDNESNNVPWVDCPFEREDQSACPFYEVEEWYEDVPLEELRQRKGYDVS